MYLKFQHGECVHGTNSGEVHALSGITLLLPAFFRSRFLASESNCYGTFSESGCLFTSQDYREFFYLSYTHDPRRLAFHAVMSCHYRMRF